MIFLIRNSHFDLYYLYSSTRFYQNEKEVIFTDKDIYDKFIPYIADFLFDTLEHYYNRDMQILRISQLFSEIIKEYIDYQ